MGCRQVAFTGFPLGKAQAHRLRPLRTQDQRAELSRSDAPVFLLTLERATRRFLDRDSTDRLQTEGERGCLRHA
jgi:hypothetical protein